jgi:diguanylate cyclase (GGDEF)-like protein/PAS domain S-box-containing protein
MNTGARLLLEKPTLRAAAEAVCGKPGMLSETFEMQHLLQELQVHQMELEMQNETLREAQTALADSRDSYADLYEFAPVGYFTLNQDTMVERINLTATTLLGLPRSGVLRRSFTRFVTPEDQPRWHQHFMRIKKTGGKHAIELSMRRDDGSVFYAQLDCVGHEGDTLPRTVWITMIDVTERRMAQAEIHRLAYYDALTKLPNRRLLQEHLDQAIAKASHSTLYGALFFIDLDNFKALNDSRGHDVGDLLLVGVAQRLKGCMQAQDLVSRQGGDEFVVLVEGLGTNTEEATLKAAQRGATLEQALLTPFDLNGYQYHCKTSIGVSLFHGTDTVAELLKRADMALYQAKHTGRGRLRFFDPAMQIAVEKRSLLESELRSAQALGQLRIYYQPQVDAGQQVVSVEALLRWQHPQRGLVLPDEFIPVAEETGLILPIGRWILEAACAQIKAWESDERNSALQVAVNVSARQFRQPDFAMQIHNMLNTSGINPSRLKLELTERLMLDDIDTTILTMQAIKQMGVHFSMDDFGTGYSSLSYLAQLPLNQIKIDKSFVRNLAGDSKVESIIRAIIAMAMGLDLSVIAEGVETQGQHQFLETQGCRMFQGFLFSKALPIDALQRFLRQDDTICA